MSDTIETATAPTGEVQEVQSGGHLILTIVALFFSLLAIAIVVIINRLGPFIKYIVEKYGSKYIKTKITVKSIEISLRNGTIEIRGIEVANPEGFSDSNIAQLDSISVKFSPRVWKKPFTIHSVIVKGTQVTYEVNLSGTNVNALLASMSSSSSSSSKDTKDQPKDQPKPTEDDEVPMTPEEAEKEAKKEKAQMGSENVQNAKEGSSGGDKPCSDNVQSGPAFVIELVDITSTCVNFGMGSVAKIPIPIIPIQMKNVGASSVSSLIYDIVAKVCEAVVSATANTASAAASAAYSATTSAISSVWGWATGSSSSSSSAPAEGSNDEETPIEPIDEVPMNTAEDEVPMGVDEVPMGVDDNGEVPMNI